MAANPTQGGTTSPAVGGPYSYPENEVVNITAIAAPGYTFAGWVGEVASSGSSSTTVTMNANQTVTANFTPNEYTLNVSVVGNGTVDRTPDQTTYHYGDVVSLAATADAGWVFDGWSGDLNGGVNPANIAMNENKSITATFVEYTQSLLDLDGAVSFNSGDDINSLTINHTTGTGTDRLMLVGVSWNCGTADRTISSVTFTPTGGSAVGLSEVITQLGYNTTNPRYSAIYSLLNPPSGQAGTVTITFSGSVSNGIVAGAANFKGVDQTTPLGISNGAAATAQGTAPGVTLTGLSGNEFVFDNVFMGASDNTQTLTIGTDQTQLWSGFAGNTRASSSIKEATGNSATMNWTAASTGWWAITAVAINPAPSSGTTFGLTMAATGNGTTTPYVGTHNYAENTVVSLSATADAGWSFSNWSGNISGSANPTTITMDGNKSVTANFIENSSEDIIISSVVPSNSNPEVNDQITVGIYINMTNMTSPNEKLGSFTGSLDWDASVLSYVSSSSLATGFSGATNPSSGHLAFNGANASGATGNILMLTITFDVVGSGVCDLDLAYSAMAAAGSFTDLIQFLTVNDA
ncbi:MAG: hypothetical protein IPF54_13215 [Draconibacterium sp.]|nr:hypothetical protein [Draconibacterium sp.]